MNKLYSFLIFGILFSGCERVAFVTNTNFEGKSEVIEQTDSYAEDYTIYSVLINGMYNRDEENSVVISNQTTSYALPYANLNESLLGVKERIPGGIADEVLENFSNKNKVPLTLQNRFNVRVPYVLLSKRDLDYIFQPGNDWIEFYRKYPGQGLIEFSRIGFNPQMNQALVYTSMQSGGKSGQGYYVFLSKEGGNWTIKYKIEIWTS